MVRCNQYSVPARFIGHRLRVKLSASALTIYDRTTVVARHRRAVGKGVKVLDLDHDLENPGPQTGGTAWGYRAGSGAAAKVFTAEHDAWWATACKTHGDAAGTRALVEVLLLHRHLDRADVVAGLSAALSVGSTNVDVVALEARKAAERRGGAHGRQNGPSDGAEVVVLAEHRSVPPSSSMSARCPRWPSTTHCWGCTPHDGPTWCH